MPIEKLDENNPLPVKGRTPLQIGQDLNTLNQMNQQATTKQALYKAIYNGKQVTLDVVKSRLLRGENNDFSVGLVMELAEQLMTYKQAEKQQKHLSYDNANDEAIYAPV